MLNIVLLTNFVAVYMNMVKHGEATIPTPWGNFLMQAYAITEKERMPHLALISEGFDPKARPTVVRIHSECLTGDLFGSKRCDCGEQLEKALEITAKNKGVIIYLRQEGRGIGLINKLKAYELQDQGMNTADANLHLGLKVDERGYERALEIMEALEIKTIRLLTNNPDKVSAIEKSPIKLMERMPLFIEPRDENINYYNTKKDVMGHIFPK